jgi:hypothetical protein
MTATQTILNELFPPRRKPGRPLRRPPKPKPPVERCQHFTVEHSVCCIRATGISAGKPACRYHVKRPRPAAEFK